MQQAKILIAGCGDIGSTLGQQLSDQGHKVFGLRRNINQLPHGIQGISADLGNLDQLRQALSATVPCDVLVYAAAADGHSEEAYQRAYVQGMSNVLSAMPNTPKHIFFTSSTGVYHQDDESWVDEESPCEPKSFTGKIMLQAEQQVLNTAIPSTVVRFSGIYGPGRNYLIKRVASGDIAPTSPALFSNRIHSHDCAGVLEHLVSKVLAGEQIESCYLASDCAPVTMHEITQWLAKELQVTPTSETLSRRAGSKRCNNAKLLASGYEFKYPSYQEGYIELLDSEQKMNK